MRASTLLLAAAATMLACAPLRKTDPETEERSGATVRSTLRVRIAEDGRIEAGGKRVKDAKKLPFPEGERVWVTAVSAPTPAALAAMAAVADEALARAWFVSARVRPSPASGNPEPKETRSAPPPMRLLTLGTDGNIAVPAGSVRPEDARSALPEGRCAPGTAIGLNGSAAPAEIFRTAGFLAAAGCEVLVVLPGATIGP